MYSVTKDGERLALTESLIYIRRHPDGFYVLADKYSAEGVMVEGVAYALAEGSLGDCPVAIVTETDGGALIGSLEAKEETVASLTEEAMSAARSLIRDRKDVSDEDAVTMPHLFREWEEVLERGKLLEAETILRKGEVLYRVVQATTPQSHYPPDGEGMLAHYRPIDVNHGGTKEDPIPWRYGMDCSALFYYTYAGKLWLCKGDMKPCVWAPDSGIWQWAEVTE